MLCASHDSAVVLVVDTEQKLRGLVQARELSLYHHISIRYEQYEQKVRTF